VNIITSNREEILKKAKEVEDLIIKNFQIPTAGLIECAHSSLFLGIDTADYAKQYDLEKRAEGVLKWTCEYYARDLICNYMADLGELDVFNFDTELIASGFGDRLKEQRPEDFSLALEKTINEIRL